MRCGTPSGGDISRAAVYLRATDEGAATLTPFRNALPTLKNGSRFALT